MNPSPKIEELVFQAVSKLETEGESAFRAFVEEHPGEKKDLLRMVRRLTGMGFVGVGSFSEIPHEMGEFELVERLGDGGMGVVFAARQKGLDRWVALKVVRPEHLFFEGGKERFRREIQAVSKLHHPGILPVLSVGEEKGIPFFAMTLVHGASLAEILAELSESRVSDLGGETLSQTLLRLTEQKAQRFSWGEDVALEPGPERQGLEEENWPRAIAHVFHRVCLAMDHAHSRGVLHRDLKPSNLMLTVDGRVFVVDFGLAREERSKDLTVSGAVLGSPAYMPPELHKEGSRALGVQSDIYSLGITLYEALALQLPFQGKSPQEIQKSIAAGTPSPLRTLAPGIPRDLEAITMKAIDVDPERRYSSMKSFAQDLGRFLRREGVRARRPNLALRLSRWSRRHPSRAFGGLAAFVAFGLLPMGLLYQESKAREQLEHEKQQALKAFGLAKGAVDRFLVKAAKEDFARTPQTKAIRRALLQEADRFYRGLQDFSLDGELKLSRLQVLSSLMSWAQELDPKKRDQYWDEARRLVASLLPRAKSSGERDRILLEGATIRSLQGEGLRIQGKEGMARRELEAALQTFEQLPERTGRAGELYFQTMLSLAYLEREAAHFPEVRKWFERILEEGKKSPKTLGVLTVLSKANLLLMGMQDGATEVAKGVTYGRKALKLAEQAKRLAPEDPNVGMILARTLYFLGRFLHRTAGDKEGVGLVRRSIAESRAILRKYPDTPNCLIHMCEGAFFLSKVAKDRGEDDLWRSHLEFARSELEEWCKTHPQDLDAKELFLKVMGGLGGYWLRRKKDKAKALVAYKRGLELAREISKAAPSNAGYRYEWAKILNDTAILHASRKEWAASRKMVEEAIAIKSELLQREVEHTPYLFSLASSLNLLGRIHRIQGRRKEGLEAFRKAFDIKKKLLQRNPRSTIAMRKFAIGAQNLAAALLSDGRKKEGHEVLEEGLQQVRKLVKAYPRNSRFRSLLQKLEALK